MKRLSHAICAGARLMATVICLASITGAARAAAFDSANPFYAPSRLPFHAPPFDRIQDADYQPAIEAGIAAQQKEIRRIADNPAPPTFANTVVALERSGELLGRANATFSGVVQANTNPVLQAAKAVIQPELAAQSDAIYLDPKLFARVAAVYERRHVLKLDAEGLRLIEVTYRQFLHEGAKLSQADGATLKKLNQEAATLENSFSDKLLAATSQAAFVTPSRAALAGLNDSQLNTAAQDAQERKADGYLISLQNTTQQPLLVSLADRATRRELFERSWNRAEQGDANDTRTVIGRLAQLRAQRAALLGYPSHAAWKLEDQMAKTPESALNFMSDLVPLATGRAARDQGDLQAMVDSEGGGFKIEAWDWAMYARKFRQAKLALDDGEVKPYFELNRVLQDGVFYAATLLYGIHFKERHDIPVYHPDVRVFEVDDVGGKPLGLFYCDYFARDNKEGGAWMSNFVDQSTLLDRRPVIYNVANLPKPAAGQPALISFDDVTTMFHEFGHALHGLFADTRYPSQSGTATPRDFVEFPSQFNEHWAIYPAIFEHYARHYASGAPMPKELADKLMASIKVGQAYRVTEVLAAAELDLRWHSLSASDPPQDVDVFEKDALARTHLDVAAVPPRYRSSYFRHIWSGGYSAGYYAYLWTQMLDDDAYAWFEEHGGLTRANGDRFRRMILSRGNTADLATLYADWRGRAPTVEAMKKYRGLSAVP